MDRLASEHQLINVEPMDAQTYHEQNNMLELMRLRSVETMKQNHLHLSHHNPHQDSKIYQNQINQQPSIGRASPPYNG